MAERVDRTPEPTAASAGLRVVIARDDTGAPVVTVTYRPASRVFTPVVSARLGPEALSRAARDAIATLMAEVLPAAKTAMGF